MKCAALIRLLGSELFTRVRHKSGLARRKGVLLAADSFARLKLPLFVVWHSALNAIQVTANVLSLCGASNRGPLTLQWDIHLLLHLLLCLHAQRLHCAARARH
jgi:hypothetical protein